MKAIKYLLTIAATLVAAIAVYAQPGCSLKPTHTFRLYPEGQESDKGLEGALGPGESNGLSRDEYLEPNGANGNISDNARIDLYVPKRPNGQMVIVCPGGAYTYVAVYNEGTYVADWMTERGITLAVLRYRMPNGHWEVPLTDVHNAFRFCRAKASEWGIDQIGVMGFSAGGHLAACASNMFKDEVTRPDFSILIYPVITMEESYTHLGSRYNLIGHDDVWDNKEQTVTEYEKAQNMKAGLIQRYSMEKNVSENTPPTFLAHSSNDAGVPVANTINYYMQLVRHNVPAEMHIYPYGGHGWGFSSEKYKGKGNDKLGSDRKQFEMSLESWLEDLRK